MRMLPAGYSDSEEDSEDEMYDGFDVGNTVRL